MHIQATKRVIPCNTMRYTSTSKKERENTGKKKRESKRDALKREITTQTSKRERKNKDKLASHIETPTIKRESKREARKRDRVIDKQRGKKEVGITKTGNKEREREIHRQARKS